MKSAQKKTAKVELKAKPKNVFRPPIVTVMGHVDHGKTTLLDTIRKTNVASREFGGITQSIGAYQVEVDTPEGKKRITFVDTPGHEAFTAMRARGAKVTDIVVLVVAADDGVKPQTVEAIAHAKAANVPIIVAINKIDLPAANPDVVKKQLSEHDIKVEEWGGDVVSVAVSAKEGKNIKELLEMILLVAEMKELESKPNVSLLGTVVESHLDDKKGPVISMIVQEGTLRKNDEIQIGKMRGKIRGMVNDAGQLITEAGPSTPVEVIGLGQVPRAGEAVFAASAIQAHEDKKPDVQKPTVSMPITVNDFFAAHQKEERRMLTLIIKADTQGSVEAIVSSLQKIEGKNSSMSIKFIHSSTGMVTESDILLAKATQSVILAFNVKLSPELKKFADSENVDIKEYKIIYKLLEEIQDIMAGKLARATEEHISGKAQVIALFEGSTGSTIAGSKVVEGILRKGNKARVKRGKDILAEGKIKTLHHLKNEVEQAQKGMEYGVTFEPNFEFEIGDMIEVAKKG